MKKIQIILFTFILTFVFAHSLNAQVEMDPGDEHEFYYTTYTSFMPYTVTVTYNGEGETYFSKKGFVWLSAVWTGSQCLCGATFTYVCAENTPGGDYNGTFTIVFKHNSQTHTINKNVIFRISGEPNGEPNISGFDEKKNITSNVIRSTDIYAIDVDSDGDMDVLSASGDDDKIVWYENNGDENFTAHIITSNADGAMEVRGIDMDNDGDIDVLTASRNNDKDAWYENDGSANFTYHKISSEEDDIHSICPADIDNDGNMDIVAGCSYNPCSIVWYKNDGNQSFTAHNIKTYWSSVGSVCTEDIDNDGDIDILLLNYEEDEIIWLENLDSENFSEHIIPCSVSKPNNVIPIDLDRDGDIDILSSSSEGDICWYENDGNENFSTFLISSYTNNINDFNVADLDSDGDFDFIASDGDDAMLFWCENNGNGDFTKHTISENVQYYLFYPADLDSDGDADIIAGAYYSIDWYENIMPYVEPIAEFTADTLNGLAPLRVKFTDKSSGTIATRLWDFGDGNTSAEINPVHIYNTPGTFTVTLSLTGPLGSDVKMEENLITVTEPDLIANFSADPVEGLNPLTVQFKDSSSGLIIGWEWDFGDGNTSSEQNPAHIYENAGAYTVSLTVSSSHESNQKIKESYINVLAVKSDFSSNIKEGYVPLTVQFENLSEGDITEYLWDFGDGQTSTDQNPEHIYYRTGIHSVSLIVTGPEGTHEKIREDYIHAIPTWPEHIVANIRDLNKPYRPYEVFSVDLDCNGHMDIIVIFRSPDEIAWYKNEGNMNFSLNTISDDIQFPTSVYAVDIDNDNDMDVLSSSANDDMITWYENDGNSIFTKNTITSDADGANSVYAADVNGDGNMDILSASGLDNKIAWYENSGSGHFETRIVTNDANYPWFVYASDINRDGNMDILSDWNSNDGIAWYENDGSQSFTTHVIQEYLPSLKSLKAIDIDNDGDMDIISSAYLNNEIIWLENTDGAGSFTQQSISTTTNSFTESVYPADLDSDGDIDIVSAVYSKINLYENNGNEIFAEQIIATDLNGVKFIQVTDMDSDGDMDIIATIPNEREIAWYENLMQALPPNAFFTANIESGEIPLTVYFSDRSSGTVLSWLWDFGDGGSSTQKYPAHTYETVGSFTVTLTVTGPEGSDAETKGNCIVSSNPSGVVENGKNLPASFAVYQNYPNPFNPSTHIEYDVKEPCKVYLIIYNLNGQVVKELVNSYQQPGNYSININMHNITSGIYFYKIQMGDFQDVRKMVKIE